MSRTLIVEKLCTKFGNVLDIPIHEKRLNPRFQNAIVRLQFHASRFLIASCPNTIKNP